MKVYFSIIIILSAAIANAQTKEDEESVRALPGMFCNAWAKHDGHELAKIMAEDVDFVTVGGVWLQGRANFEKYHTRLLAGRFSNASNTPLEIRVRLFDRTRRSCTGVGPSKGTRIRMDQLGLSDLAL
jgi:hypothetical protein